MFDFLSATMAFAQDGGDGGTMSALMGPIPMLIVMGAVFYFLLIRPQQRKNKEIKNMLAGLRKGDEVVTRGGIYGKITGISENTVVLEIAPQVRIKLHRPSVSTLITPGSSAIIEHPDQTP